MPGGRLTSGAAQRGLGLTQGPALRRTNRLDCSAVTVVKFLHGGSKFHFLWSRKSRGRTRTSQLAALGTLFPAPFPGTQQLWPISSQPCTGHGGPACHT